MVLFTWVMELLAFLVHCLGAGVEAGAAAPESAFMLQGVSLVTWVVVVGSSRTRPLGR